MAATALDLEKRYSGGAANQDPNLSLGGVMSTDANGIVDEQVASGITNITGVTVVGCGGNNDGNGTLTWDDAAETMQWTAPGDTIGLAVSVTSDGNYVMYSATKGYIALSVTYASLPVSNQSDTVNVSTTANTLWDNITKAESFNGDTEYRCIYLKNNHATDSFFGVAIYVDQQPTADDSFEIGLDPAGINGTATTIVDESTAPAGVTFSSPTSGSPLNIGTLAAQDIVAVWIKRLVPALSSTSTTNDRSRIGIVAFA